MAKQLSLKAETKLRRNSQTKIRRFNSRPVDKQVLPEDDFGDGGVVGAIGHTHDYQVLTRGQILEVE